VRAKSRRGKKSGRERHLSRSQRRRVGPRKRREGQNLRKRRQKRVLDGATKRENVSPADKGNTRERPRVFSRDNNTTGGGGKKPRLRDRSTGGSGGVPDVSGKALTFHDSGDRRAPPGISIIFRSSVRGRGGVIRRKNAPKLQGIFLIAMTARRRPQKKREKSSKQW